MSAGPKKGTGRLTTHLRPSTPTYNYGHTSLTRVGGWDSDNSMPKTRGSHRADEKQRRCSQCAFSPGKLIPNKFPFRGLSFSGHACRISRAHTWGPPSVSIDVSLASVHSLRVILTWPSTEPLPRVSAVPPALARRCRRRCPERAPVPPALARAVRDAVPSARCWPASFLSASLLIEALPAAVAA